VTERGGARVTSRPARGHRVWEPAAGAPESQPESGVALGRQDGGAGTGGSPGEENPGRREGRGKGSAERGSARVTRVGRDEAEPSFGLPPARPVRREGGRDKKYSPYRMPPRSARTPRTRVYARA